MIRQQRQHIDGGREASLIRCYCGFRNVTLQMVIPQGDEDDSLYKMLCAAQKTEYPGNNSWVQLEKVVRPIIFFRTLQLSRNRPEQKQKLNFQPSFLAGLTLNFISNVHGYIRIYIYDTLTTFRPEAFQRSCFSIFDSKNHVRKIQGEWKSLPHHKLMNLIFRLPSPPPPCVIASLMIF